MVSYAIHLLQFSPFSLFKCTQDSVSLRLVVSWGSSVSYSFPFLGCYTNGAPIFAAKVRTRCEGFLWSRLKLKSIGYWLKLFEFTVTRLKMRNLTAYRRPTQRAWGSRIRRRTCMTGRPPRLNQIEREVAMQRRSSEVYGHPIAPKRAGSAALRRESGFPGEERLQRL